MGVGEAAVGFVDLQAGQSQIHEHRVDAMDTQVMEYTIELVKGGVHRGEAGVEAFLAHPLGRHAQRFTVSVDTDQPRSWGGFEERARMTGQTERAVDDNASGLLEGGGDEIDALVKQYRLVDG